MEVIKCEMKYFYDEVFPVKIYDFFVRNRFFIRIDGGKIKFWNLDGHSHGNDLESFLDEHDLYLRGGWGEIKLDYPIEKIDLPEQFVNQLEQLGRKYLCAEMGYFDAKRRYSATKDDLKSFFERIPNLIGE